MAQRVYRSNGSAAVDYYADNTVHVPQSRPQPRPRPKKKVRAKVEIAPFAVIGALVTLFLLVMVVQTQVRLFELKTAESKLNSTVMELDQQIEQLRSDYEGRVNLRAIEQEAKTIGMRKPTASQTVYLNIDGADSAEVLHYEQKGFFGTLWDAVSNGFRGVVEYFG